MHKKLIRNTNTFVFYKMHEKLFGKRLLSGTLCTKSWLEIETFLFFTRHTKSCLEKDFCLVHYAQKVG